MSGAEIVCECSYDLTSEKRIESQIGFRNSKARIRGYGGAVGGGKSRALCEEVFDWMLEYPGIIIPVFRQVHTHITDSTRKTFIEQVLPQEIRGRKDLVRVKESQGQDFIQLWNGSTAHFVGLDNPDRWFSTEIGAAAFDEAHEISEDDVMAINRRLRQRCKNCIATGESDCTHMPYRMILTFNPSHPQHWLRQWFVLGATKTLLGYRKDALFATDAKAPIGDAEYFVARATENKFLPTNYIEQSLASMSELQRRRYFEGQWIHIGGNSFFDADALTNSMEDAAVFQPVQHPVSGGQTTAGCEPAGNLAGTDTDDIPRIKGHRSGRMLVFRPPVRWHVTGDGEEIKAHRYVVAVDASSGVSSDWSAVQVIDQWELEQVAEWQGKVDPDKLAEVAFLTACVFNGAVLAPEITGGWGFAVVKRCQRMIAEWRGPAASKPQLYTRPVVDRLSQRFTDLIGWDTNTKSRAQMLDVLEQSLRDGSLSVHGERTLDELAAFAIPDRIGEVGDYRSPRAQKGAHDDLVIALAIGTAVAVRLPRDQKPPPQPLYEPTYSATGY